MRNITFVMAALLLAGCSKPSSAHEPLYAVQDCNKATNQMDLNQCADANFESADRALNEVYRKLMEAQADQPAKDKLHDSERLWIKFRDGECARQVGPREGGGSIWPMDYANCLETKTAERLRELRRSLDCPDGPNACGR
jgi:uncharacterized protein YecT (DUF1311 family)